MAMAVATKVHDPEEYIRSLKEKQYRSLGTEMERQTREQGEKTALIFEDRVISYRELNAQANRYANYFAGLGFKAGDVVALLMENRPEYLIAGGGLSKLGVIVSLINNGVRGDALAHAINICGAGAVIVGNELLDVLLAVKDDLHLNSPALFLVENEGQPIEAPPGFYDTYACLAEAEDINPATTRQVSTDDVIVYIYTSGTTGFPKACAVTQRRWLLLANIYIQFGKMTADTVHYLALPLYHNSGFNAAYAALLVYGNTMVLRRRFSASAFWDDVRRYHISAFIYVGEMCRYIFNQPQKSDDADNPLCSMLGNGLRGDLMEPFRQRFGLESIIEVYGATEGVGLMVNLEEIPGMCGNLVVNGLRQGEIVKWDFEKEEMIRGENNHAVKCDPGEMGLLVCEINALNSFAGYVNNPAATEAKMLRNLLAEGDQYFNSGDLVQLHECDYFSFIDRLGDNYRWKSENVSTNQVSNAINKFSHIEDANVYGVRVPGMEGRCGMAALKMMEGEDIDWEDFSAFIIKELPVYARPYFIRLRPVLDANNSFKQIKQNLQKEGFDPAAIADPLYFLHPEQNRYIPLTGAVYRDIVEQRFRF